MTNCDHQLLSAYVDGELDASVKAAVEEHVRRCADCAFELAELRDLSGRIGRIEYRDVTSEESQRIHDAMDLTEEKSILRLGSVIGVIAASILVVCGTWLAVLPSNEQAAGNASSNTGGVSMMNTEPWERTALTLQSDPSSPEDGSQYAVDWMLQGLSNTSGNGP